ncbi:MAG: MG2 domain-containing protein [Planctomycetota bacterium]|nr:MG2 domain-containing protein [Planctomycetota bacterium]
MSPEKQQDIEALTEDYLHGLLKPEQARQVEALAASDPAWRAGLDAARRRLDAVQGVPGSEASEALIQKTLARVGREAQRELATFGAGAFGHGAWSGVFRLRSAGFAAALAACVALLASLQVYYDGLAPGPMDLRIVAQGELLAGEPGAMRVRLVNRETGRPVAGAPVDIELHRPDTGRTVRLASLVTDRQGTGQPRFNWPAWASDVCELRVVARASAGGASGGSGGSGGSETQEEQVVRRVRLVQAWRLDLTSDRPVYEPGQTVNLRAFAWNRSKGQAITSDELVFSLTDPAGKVVGMESSHPSRFGIASSSVTLPDDAREGLYRLECFLGDASVARTIEVGRRSAASFRVNAELDRPFYQPGQMVRGQVNAAYFHGQAVKGAKAEVRIESADAARAAAGPLVGPVTLALDDAGHANFELALPGSLHAAQGGVNTDSLPDAAAADRNGEAVTLVVNVIDDAGRREVRRIERVVAAEPIRIDLIPEAGELVAGVANRVYVLANYPDGRPAKAHLSVAGIDRGAERELVTDDAGAASFECRPRGQEVALTVRARDEQGLATRQELYLPVGGRRGSEDFLIRTDRASYRGGEAVEVLALGAGDEPVFVDLVQDGQTIQTQSLEMKAGRGVGRIDLPADVNGTIRVVGYRMGATPGDTKIAGVAGRRVRWIEARPAQDLHVAVEVDRDQYKPGDEAKLSFRVTDSKGQPAPGALSLAAVDEAALALADNAGGSDAALSTWRAALLARASARSSAPADPMQELIDGGFIEARDAERARAIVREPWGAKRLSEMVLSGMIPKEVGRLLDDGEAAATPAGASSRHAGVRLVGLDALASDSVSTVATASAPEAMLTAASYPTKLVRVAAERRTALALINAGWAVLAVGAIVVGFVAMLRRVRSTIAVALLIGALFASVGGVLAGMNAGSRSYLGNAAAAELRTVGRALDRAGQAGAMPMALREDDADDVLPVPRAPRAAHLATPPRTLLWRPEVITDDHGRASLSVPLPDVLTTWRLTASAVNATGELGASAGTIRVSRPLTGENTASNIPAPASGKPK